MKFKSRKSVSVILLKRSLLFILIFIFAYGCSQENSGGTDKRINVSQEPISKTPKREIQKLVAEKTEWPPYELLKELMINTGQKEKLNPNKYIVNNVLSSKIIPLFKNDVIDFYSLQVTYSSPLQKKMFKKSRAFEAKSDSLRIQKELLKNKVFYFDWKLENSNSQRNYSLKYDLFLDYYDNDLQYNLDSKSFTVSTIVGTKEFSDEPYFIYPLEPPLVFKLPDGITKSTTNFESILQKKIDQYRSSQLKYGDNFMQELRERYPSFAVKEDLYLKIENEDIALDIENNSSDIHLLFIFKIVDLVNNKSLPKNISMLTKLFPPQYLFTTKVHKIVIYNNSTGKIYKEYQ